MDDHSDHVLAALRELEQARDLVAREVACYPVPIAGCDAQFNHLLSEQACIRGALAALAETPFVPTPRLPAPDSQ